VNSRKANASLIPSDYREKIESKLSSYLTGGKCTRCLLPASFRSIVFDEEGVCKYCHDYQALSDSTGTLHRREEFVRILEDAQRKAGTSYDCVVCLSGGKDSTYLLDLLNAEYGLRIVAVTVDTGFLSDIARQNIQKAISKLQVDHVFLEAPPGIFDVYRYGFTHPSESGVENDVCDLCDGIIRKECAQFAIDNNIPLIVDGLDPFQLIDAGLHKPDPGIEDSLSCWPERARRDGIFQELYELSNFSSELIPFELYPFLYLPYDAEFITQKVEGKSILVNPDPNLTNCRFTYLLDFLDLLRMGFPAYIHNISSDLRQKRVSPRSAKRWIQRAFLEYAEGYHNKHVLDAVHALDLDLTTLIPD
jgi:hypothetical protein